MYRIRIEKVAQRALEKIDDPYYSKIKKAILNLAKTHDQLGVKN